MKRGSKNRIVVGRRLVASVALVLLSATGTLSAQEAAFGDMGARPYLPSDLPEKAGQPGSLLFDLDLNADPEDLRASLKSMAEVSAQRMVKVSAGETIRDVVIRIHPELRTFGPDKDRLVDGLAEVVQGQNASLLAMLGYDPARAARGLPGGLQVAFPDLPRLGKTRTVVAAADTTFENLAQLHLGDLTDADRVAVARANSGFGGQVVARAHQWLHLVDAPSLNTQLRAGDPLILERTSLADVLLVRPDLQAEDAVRSLKKEAPGIRNAEVPTVAKLVTTTESKLPCCDHRPLWYGDLIGIDELDTRDLTGLSRVTVAVMDSGLDLGHPEFQDSLVSKRRFSVIRESNGEAPLDDEHKEGHGTAVSGLATGRMLLSTLPTESRKEVENALRLLVLRVARKSNEAGVADINIDGIYSLMRHAERFSSPAPVRVINMSLVYPPNSDDLDLLKGSIRLMSNTLFVAASGNEGVNLDQGEIRVFPAIVEMNNLIAVGALDDNGGLYASSNHGARKVQIAAPGRAIWSTVPVDRGSSCPASADLPSWVSEGRHWCLSGTSLAAPLVSFTAGLLSARGLPDGARIKRRLLASCDWRPELAQCSDKDDKCIERGCTLNVGRALSLGRDLVEVSSGGRRNLLRGRIETDISVTGGCGSFMMEPSYHERFRDAQGRLMEDRFILRVSRGPAEGGLTFMLSQLDAQALYRVCEGSFSQDHLEIRLSNRDDCPAGAGLPTEGLLPNGRCRVLLSKVQEIVFRDPAFCSEDDRICAP